MRFEGPQKPVVDNTRSEDVIRNIKFESRFFLSPLHTQHESITRRTPTYAPNFPAVTRQD